LWSILNGNRKTIFEKLDWLKDTLEDLITKANRNIGVQQEQLRAIVGRLTALEKRVRKSAPVTAAERKKPARALTRRTTRQPPSKRKR
jgi:uncharacterized coiled-coil protein SlyX